LREDCRRDHVAADGLVTRLGFALRRLQRQESARDVRMQALNLTKPRSLVALPRPSRPAPKIHYIRLFPAGRSTW
jgi:hypothetical protein